MPDANKAAEAQLKRFLDEDLKRKQDPVNGQRRTEQVLMGLCDMLKAASPRVDDQVRQKIVKTLQGMNLVPYRSYCREHLLDIGITNV